MEKYQDIHDGEPILVTRFYDIRESVDLTPTLDDFTNILEDEDHRRHFFEEAKRSFEYVRDREKLIKCLEQEPSKENYKYLKNLRRFGLILKAAYRFVDSSHMCTEDLNDFLFLLGKFNDHYWVAHTKEDVRQIVEKFDHIKFPIDYISTKKFKEYAEKLLDDIEKLFGNRELKIRKFHSLRKKIRTFSNFMQVLAAENCGKEPHWLFYSLLSISTELGDKHDELLQKGLEGEIEYHDSVVELNPKTAEEFTKLKPFIKKMCGLV